MKISELKSPKSFAETAIDYIATMPDDEVLTLAELAERIGRQPPSSGPCYFSLKAHGLRGRRGGRVVWAYGNPKALKALKKHLDSI